MITEAKQLIKRQYGSRSSALRAIRNFCNSVDHWMEDEFIVNRLDEGCHEVNIISKGSEQLCA